jgi:CBS domain-containing protein
MNIQTFMKPRYEVTFIYEDDTVGHTVDILETKRFGSIPVLSRDEKYVGTISEGDLLYFICNSDKKTASKSKVSELTRNHDYLPINISDSIASLINRAANENFVPIIDDAGIFLGIVTRKKLLDYFFETKFIVL